MLVNSLHKQIVVVYNIPHWAYLGDGERSVLQTILIEPVVERELVEMRFVGQGRTLRPRESQVECQLRLAQVQEVVQKPLVSAPARAQGRELPRHCCL